MEDDKDMYDAMVRMSKMVDIMYGAYEKRIEEEEKERSENDASSTSSSAYASSSSPSSYSHHSNEEIKDRKSVV